MNEEQRVSGQQVVNMTTKQKQINKINRLVKEFKDNDNMESAEQLLIEFDAYLKKQTHRLRTYYKGVHSWEHALHEAQTIFYELLTEYKIGGNAYFTVYIQRKLPLRFRYFFVKEIKRRTRELSHSDEQFKEKRIMGDTGDIMQDVIDNIDDKGKLRDILDVINDGITLTDREKDMLLSSIINQESHEQISQRHGISRSRTSRIIKKAIEKVQKQVKLNEER